MRGTLLCTTAALAAGVALSACGSETLPNDPRPPVPSVLSVSISRNSIDVSPRILKIPGKRPVNISQNRTAPVNQGDRETPAVISVAISNLTTRDTELVLEGPVDRTVPLTATASGSFQEAMPNGIYRVSSPASFGTARFAVGPSRVSASGDVLTP